MILRKFLSIPKKDKEKMYELYVDSYKYLSKETNMFGIDSFEKYHDKMENRTCWVDYSKKSKNNGDKTVNGFLCYKKTPFGKKYNVLSTNGEKEVKIRMVKKWFRELQKNGNYSEMSGKLAEIAKDKGFKPICNHELIKAIIEMEKCIDPKCCTYNVDNCGYIVKESLYGNPKIKKHKNKKK